MRISSHDPGFTWFKLFAYEDCSVMVVISHHGMLFILSRLKTEQTGLLNRKTVEMITFF